MLKPLQSFLKANKFPIIACLIAMLFIANPFTAKAQFIDVSGAGSTYANGRYTDYGTDGNGSTLYRRTFELRLPNLSEDYVFLIFYSTILSKWVIQQYTYYGGRLDLYASPYTTNRQIPPKTGYTVTVGLYNAPTLGDVSHTLTYYTDADGDGYSPSPNATTADFHYQNSCTSCTFTYRGPDCNDNNAAVNAIFSGYRDVDGDGFGAGAISSYCATSLPAGYVANGTDCNDNDATKNAVFPFYVDNDRDGYGIVRATVCAVNATTPPPGYILESSYDCDDNDATKHTLFQFYVDADGDGYGAAGNLFGVCAANAASPPRGYSTNNTDCNDNDPSVFAIRPFYYDNDGDGYGSTTVIYGCLSTPPASYVTNNTDCNDSDGTKHATFPFYVDADGDGFGAGSVVSVCAVNATTPPSGYSTNNTDCNDNNAIQNATFPFYVDADGDGFGAGNPVSFCAVNANAPPSGYSANNTDCNDNVATINRPPTIIITTTNATPCIGSPTTLTASGATSTYSWSDGVTNGVPFTPTTTKTYTVTASTSNCTGTATRTITINPLPNVTTSALNSPFCNSPTTVLHFDGVDDYIYQPFAINGNSGTWQAWVQKADWTDHHNDILFGNGIDAGSNNSFYISLHPGVGLHFRYGGAGQAGNNYVSSIITKSFAPNSWHHLAAAWIWNGNQTVLALYIDGVQVTNDVAILNLALSAPTYIGGDPVGPKFGAGSMKEISLWSIARTGIDIANTYTSSTTYPQFGMYSLLSFNNANANQPNTDRATDNANVPSALINFALNGASSNYISQDAPINRFVTLTGGGAATYTWSNGVTNAVPFVPTATNTYTVTGTDANGCVNTASRLVTVNPAPSLSINANTISACLSSTTVLNFDGVDDYMYQPFAINGNSGTWQAWVQKANWADVQDQRLFGNGIDAGSNNSFYISLHPGVGLHFRYGGAGQAGNNYASSIITQSFAANSWHHIAAAWYWNGSQTVLVLYVDGVSVANNVSTLNLALSEPTYIGGDAVNPKFGAGSMKDISLWSIPRSPIAIANTYATNTTFPQFGMYSLLNFNNAILNATNADRATDNVNVPSALINFALNGTSSNYISAVVPIIQNPIVLTASGASAYIWSGGITNGSPFGLTATKTYTVTGTDANGCTNTASQTITVNEPLVATITGEATGCGSVTLTANGGVSYLWSGGSTPSVSTNTFTTSGNYTVTVTSANGCTNVINRTVTVTTAAPPTVSIAASPSLNITSGTNVTFTATPTNIGGTPQYQWLLNNVNVGTNSPTYSNNALTNGNVIACVLTTNDPCQAGLTATSNALTMRICATTTILYVKPTASGTGDGSSWANATNDLQTALSNPCINQIWVAKGTYTPSATDRTLSFNIPSGMKVYGGFAGTETTITARTAITTTNLTILSGDLAGNDVGFANNEENSYTVVKFLNASAATLLDGLTIQGANNSIRLGDAGGIYNLVSGTGNISNPQINNCIVTGNTTANRGGGLFNNNTGGTCSPTLTNCSFSGNAAFIGGGICNNGANGISSPTATNCVFAGNTAFIGGGIYNNGVGGISSPTFTNCSFAGNYGQYGGGVYNLGTNGVSSATLTNCVFFGNNGSNTFSNPDATTTANYCLFDNTVTEYTGSSNLTTTISPFVSITAPYDLHLLYCASALNTGNNSAISLTTDIEGNPRIYNATVDRGAYELQVSPSSRLYVDATKTSGSNTGLSWQNAFIDLQSALTHSACSSNSEIWVAGGTYKPSRDVSGNANPTDGRSKTFLISNSNPIYGSFAGTETSLAQRTLAIRTANPSILSGDFNSDDGVTGTGATLNISGVTENARHVVVISTPSVPVRFDGFTVTGGSALSTENILGIQDAGGFGGGLLVAAGDGTNITITNCIISKNRALSGGGLYLKGSNLTLTDCVFDRNYGENGGCLFLASGSAVYSNCVFSGNRATGTGGGTYASTGANSTFTNCTFTGNAAANAGGLFVLAAVSTSINSIFWGNTPNGIASSAATHFATYSVVQDGNSGTGNLFTDPFFNNAANPLGADGIWLTADDGLRLGCGSSAYNTGTNTNAPTADVLGNAIFGSVKDIGAYESPTALPNFTSSVSIAISPSTSITAGTNVTFTATITNGGGTPQYQWLLNSVNVGTNSSTYSNNALRNNDVVACVLTADYICRTTPTVTSNTFTMIVCTPTSIVYVKPTASGTGEGTSWANAANNLQIALNNTCGITEVWVAKGTYKPSSADRTVSFTIPSGIKVYGGFAGTETTLTARNTVTNATILSGDLVGNDVGFTNNGENSYTVVKFLNASAATVLDGFTIRGANNPNGGGGIYNEGAGTGNSSNPQISNCIVTSNTTSNRGGGLFNNNTGGTCSPTLTNCSFAGNNAFIGGGIYSNGTGGVSSPILTNCSFGGNTADYGSAMYNLGVNGISSPTLTNCVFFGNGGSNTFSNPNATITATYCLFDNTVTEYTGSLNLTTTVLPFVSAVAPFDLRLAPCSVAINAGNNSAISLTTDIEGNPRKNGVTDIGAYEFQGSSTTTNIATENQTSAMNVASSGMTYFSNNCNNLILGLVANGSTPISGMVEGRVWIETTAPPTFVKRHYQITPSINPNGASGRVTLYFTQTDLNDFNSLNASKLPTSSTDVAGIARFRIEKRSGTSNDGTGLPTSYTGAINIINPDDGDIFWNAPSSRWEVSFDVTDFSGFFATSQSVVLPVELLEFKATKLNTDQVHLDWLTASEKDNAYFDVERSSDANTFVNIGQVKGFGTKGTPQYYSLLDAKPSNGVNYYRLKQVDTNGKFVYSKTISIVLSKSNNPLKAYPNPVSNVLIIETEATGNYQVFNLLGQQILRGSISTKQIDVSALPEGSYILKVGEEEVKFVKN